MLENRSYHTLSYSLSPLADQLSNNNQLLEQLRTQSTVVKGQAVHTGVGFPLRRFNVDISDGELLVLPCGMVVVPLTKAAVLVPFRGFLYPARRVRIAFGPGKPNLDLRKQTAQRTAERL